MSTVVDEIEIEETREPANATSDSLSSSSPSRS